MRLFSLLFLTFLLFACAEKEEKTTPTVPNTPTPAVSAPTPTDDADISVGKIKNACDLVTEADIRLLSVFLGVGDINRRIQTSPDNHTSVCQFLAKGKGMAFILSYHKNAANTQLLNDFINSPNYKEIEGLGEKAAFNKEKGQVKWIGKNGVQLTADIFPTSPQNVDAQYEDIYNLAKKIDERFHND